MEPHSPTSDSTATDDCEVRQLDLANDVLSASEARAFVREVLAEWGYPGIEADASLAVSELVTNAVIHAHSPSRVVLINMGGAIQLRVADQEPSLPEVQQALSNEDHGRGMALVESISQSWGVESCPPGKIVWLDITQH